MSLQAQCVRRQNDMFVVQFTFVVFSGRVDRLVTSWMLTVGWTRSSYLYVTISYRSWWQSFGSDVTDEPLAIASNHEAPRAFNLKCDFCDVHFY
jgi:hypothetical protein